MSRDPAFLFYDGDAARDVSHMNRLERGCYFDLMQAQRKFGRLSIELIQKVLGKDFETCWETVKICMTYENHMFFIDWVEEQTLKRRKYSESRSINRSHIKGVTCDEHMKTHDEHMENEIENERYNVNNGNKGGVVVTKSKFNFDEIWAKYPNKDGRKAAKAHFEVSVKTQDDWNNINKALENYIKSEKVQKGFIKNGSTWFNNWQDWVSYEEPVPHDGNTDRVKNLVQMVKGGRNASAV